MFGSEIWLIIMFNYFLLVLGERPLNMNIFLPMCLKHPETIAMHSGKIFFVLLYIEPYINEVSAKAQLQGMSS